MTIRLQQVFKKYESKKNLLIGFGILLLVNLVLFPMFPKLFSIEISPNEILDLKFGYNHLEVQHIFDNLQENGRSAYKLSTIFIDIPYLIFYSFYYAVLLNYLFKKKQLNKFTFLILLPFCIGIFDLFENIGIISLLNSYPILDNNIILLSSLATILKWSFAILTVILLFFLVMKKKPEVNIIGSGVIGLTTAVLLSKNGYKVSIYTEKTPQNTTSAVAAAIWFPYNAEPKEKVSKWSAFSYNYYQELASIPNSGVKFVPLTIIEKDIKDCWWLDAIPNKNYKKINDTDLPKGCKLGFEILVPFIESAVFLVFLERELKKIGGKIIHQKIKTFDDLDKTIPIVNCSGLGAIELCNDTELFPVKGQIVTVAKQTNIPSIIINYPVNKIGDELSYIVVRNNDIVLGGTAISNDFNTEPDAIISQKIIKRCKNIVPNIQNTTIIEEKVGLRPKRTRIRLENKDAIIHNYGHGGAGFTIAWGCADAVLKLLEKNN